jgi:hypothetical protein
MERKHKANWWLVYATLPLMIALLLIEARIPGSLLVHRILEFGIVLLSFGLMALWVHGNQAALSNEESEKQRWTLEPDPKLEIIVDPNLLPDEPFDPMDSPLALEFDHTKGRYN